jgi:hypothetical protein
MPGTAGVRYDRTSLLQSDDSQNLLNNARRYKGLKDVTKLPLWTFFALSVILLWKKG